MKRRLSAGKLLTTGILLLLTFAYVRYYFLRPWLLTVTVFSTLLLLLQKKKPWLHPSAGWFLPASAPPLPPQPPAATEKLFQALMEHNEALFALIDEQGRFLFCSSAAFRITGWDWEIFKAIPYDFIHPDDVTSAQETISAIAKEPGKTIPLAFRLRHKLGHYIWLQGSISNLLQEPGIGGIIINLHDITAQKEAEEKNIRDTRLYFFISQINQMIVKTKDEATLFREACQIAVSTGKFRMAWIGVIDASTKTLQPVTYAGEEDGYLTKINISSVSEKPEGKGPTGTALRESRHIVCNDIEKSPEMAPWKDAAMGRGYLSSISLPITKSGAVMGAFTLYAPVTDFFNAGEIELLRQVTGDISFAMDIFENEKQRKTAEEEQLKSKQRYQTLTEVAPAGIFHTDAAGYTTYVNPRWCRISGMSASEALGNGWLNAVHTDDKAGVVNGWEAATKKSDLSFSEYRFVRPDGSIAWVLGQAIPERDSDNRIIGYVGIITDITERREAQQKIEKIYKEKETVLNRISDAMISVDNDWRYTFINDAAMTDHPLSKEASIGKIIWDIHPEMKGTMFWEKYHLAMHDKKVVEFENFYPPFNRWFSVKIYPAPDGLTIFYRDITEHKKTEEQILKNEIRLRKAQEIGKMGYWQQELNSDIVWASKQAMNIYGFPEAEGELTKEQIARCIVDAEKVQEAFTNLVEHNKPYNIELRIKPATGGPIKYISALAELEKNEKGEPERIVGTLQDISERIMAKNEIIKERVLSDSVINSLPGVVYLYNKDLRFLRWNKNFETVTGYSAEEIRQMHPLDFFDTTEKNIVANKIDSTFKSGEATVQAAFLLKTKEKIPYYFTGKAINYEGTDCLVGVGIDFTERINDQQKIKETTEQLRLLTAHLQSIREEERKRIGREIHDELGQQLTAIKMDIAWIDKKTPQDAGMLKAKLKNVITLLDGSNQSIRRILSELRPVILDDHGLVDAMEWIGKQLTGNTGISLKFISSSADIKLPERVATCIFRVYQEALTNIVRHSGADRVEASLFLKEDTVIVSIEDNGRGFTPTAVQGNKSFGILGMKERVLSLGGVFELDAQPGNGTSISIQLPATV